MFAESPQKTQSGRKIKFHAIISGYTVLQQHYCKSSHSPLSAMATGVSHVIVEVESGGEAAADLLHSQTEEPQAENLRYEDAASMSEPTEVPEEVVCHVCTVHVL